MKKTKVLSVFLLAVALIFASCSSPTNSSPSSSSSDNSSGSGGGNGLPPMDVSDFSDCTVDASSFEIQNNTNWSLRFMQNEMPAARTARAAGDDAPPFTLEMDITTNYSNNNFTFTSGKFTQTMKTSDCMGAEDYEEYRNLTPEYKQLYKMVFFTVIAQALEESGYATLLDGDINDDYIRIVYSLSSTYLTQLENAFKQAINSSDKSLKTNNGRNKYIVVSSGNSFYMKKL